MKRKKTRILRMRMCGTKVVYIMMMMCRKIVVYIMMTIKEQRRKITRTINNSRYIKAVLITMKYQKNRSPFLIILIKIKKKKNLKRLIKNAIVIAITILIIRTHQDLNKIHLILFSNRPLVRIFIVHSQNLTINNLMISFDNNNNNNLISVSNLFLFNIFFSELSAIKFLIIYS